MALSARILPPVMRECYRSGLLIGNDQCPSWAPHDAEDLSDAAGIQLWQISRPPLRLRDLLSSAKSGRNDPGRSHQRFGDLLALTGGAGKTVLPAGRSRSRNPHRGGFGKAALRPGGGQIR